MNRLFLIAFFLPALFPASMKSQTVIPGGFVYGTWALSGSPYLVEGDIELPSVGTLTIDAGVDVIFQGHYKFIVSGILHAVGTETDSVTFTAADTAEGWHSLRFHDAPDTCRLTYCVIKHAVSYGYYPSETGGGIYIENSSPYIEHCAITSNQAARGGGIYSRYSNPTIRYCDIVNNVVTYGTAAAMYAYQSNPVIENCLISENSVTYGSNSGFSWEYCSGTISECQLCSNAGSGAAIICLSVCDVEILDCLIEYNVDGGIWCTGYPSPLIDGVIIRNNSGCGISCTGIGSPTIENCEISTNNGTGIICSSDSTPLIRSSIITGNASSGIKASAGSEIVIDGCEITGNYTNQSGGGIWFYAGSSGEITNTIINENECGDLGGGIACEFGGNFIMTDCDISRNRAGDQGGGISLEFDTEAHLTRCVLANDTANSRGSAVYADHGALTAINCTFSANESHRYGAIYLENTFSELNLLNTIMEGHEIAIEVESELPVSISYCDFFNIGNPQFEGYCPPGLGQLVTTNANGDSSDIYSNIFLDPLFVDPDSSDYNLQENSPCIDAGDPESPLDPDSTIVDMGAFYYSQSALIDPEDQQGLPGYFYLLPSYPNPFNAETVIRYQLPIADQVLLRVFDIQGRLIETLIDSQRQPGFQEFVWNAAELPSGIYLIQMQAGNMKQVRKTVLMK
jgi:hypothetical protein